MDEVINQKKVAQVDEFKEIVTSRQKKIVEMTKQLSNNLSKFSFH